MDRRDCNDNEMTEDFDYAGEGEQMFHGSPLPGGSYFTFTMPSDLHVPSLSGSISVGRRVLSKNDSFWL